MPKKIKLVSRRGAGKNKRRVFARLLVGWLVFVLVFGALVLPTNKVSAQAVQVDAPFIDDLLNVINTSIKGFETDKKTKKTWDQKLKSWAGLTLLKVLDNFASRMAQKIAVGIATGAKGGKPMISMKEMGNYLKDSKDAAAGDFLSQLGTDLGWEGLCKPNLSVRLQIGLGLFNIEQPPKPTCTWDQMKDNWNEAVNDPDFLKNFSLSFDPRQTDVGNFLTLSADMSARKAEELKAAEKKRGPDTEGGYLPKLSKISDEISTAAGDIFSLSKLKLDAGWRKEEAKAGIGADLVDGSITVISTFINTLAKSLFNEIVKEYLSGTYTLQGNEEYPWDKFCDNYPDVCGDGDEDDNLSDPDRQEKTLSKSQVEVKYSRLFETTSTFDSGEYDILPELSSCPDPQKPGPTTCVIDTNFSQAITDHKTVQEAINEGLLDENKVVGFNEDGTQPSYLDGYPYRSLLILRKYRIIPVGWELAAQYVDEANTTEVSLKDLINAYDDPSSDYYRLVDPDWVLKVPAGYCKARGVGPEILSTTVNQGSDFNEDGDWDDENDLPPSTSVTRNDQYCADEQSCIKENFDGTCAYYGYCMEEKRLWKFDGDACEAKYNTCQAFIDSDGGVVSYLKNSLDWDDCSVDNSGCMWYCDDFNQEANKLVSDGAVGYWRLDDGIGSTISDDSGNSNDGTLNDFPEDDSQWVNGKWGKALKFDGADDYVETSTIDSSISEDNPWTISVWVKTENDPGSGWSDIVYVNGADGTYNPIVYRDSTGVYGIGFRDSAQITSTTIATGQWTHVVGTYSGSLGTLTLYINGIIQNTATISTAGNGTANNIRLGYGSFGSSYFDGYIDEVAIYNSVLSPEEIWNNYSSYSCINNNDKIYISSSATSCDSEDAGCGKYLAPESGLVGFWEFDEDTGSVVYDSSGYGNKGNLIGSPSWTTGNSGQALSFDGSTDYIQINDDESLDIAPAITLAAWVRSSDDIGNEFIIAKWGAGGESYGMRLDDANLRFFLSASGATTAKTFDDLEITANTWNHLAAVWDGAVMKGYLNGVISEQTENFTSLLDLTTENIYLGSNEGDDSFFEGDIDEMAIYNRALSESEVFNLYNSGISFSSKYTKAPNKNIHCFGRTSGDATFDLPSYTDNCISLGSRFDSTGQGSCFEFLAFTDKDDCAENNGAWLNSAMQIPRHTVQPYCEASGGEWTGVQCQTQCLKKDDAVCDNYAFSCKADEVGCEKYTPTDGSPWIPGIISDDDTCPSECAGYDTYKQEATNFETSEFPVNFIPDTANSCSSASAGCDQFTNLEAIADGGEGLEYYSYLRQCERIPSENVDYQCNDFYTWVGGEATGYQLQSYFLKSPNGVNEPVEILRVEENLGDCNDANDALFNKNCKEFYNSDGQISYHLLKKTITCSNDCVSYRKSVPANFDLTRICENIDGDWNSAQCDINTETACKAINGSWNGSTCSPSSITDSDFCANTDYLAGEWNSDSSTCSKTDYQAIPDEGITCSASANGCREYTGNAGSNIQTVFDDGFESNSYIYNFPDPNNSDDPNGGNGWNGGQLSSESTVAGQQSLKVDDGASQMISKWLSATCELASTCTNDEGCDCTETEFGNTDNDSPAVNETVCTVAIDNIDCSVANYTYDESSYLLSFWAKGNNNNEITVRIADNITNAQNFGVATLSDQWQFYTLGPLEFDVENWGNYNLQFDGIKSNDGTADSLLVTYFDNIRLVAISDSVYKIKNSWNTPSSCDQDRDGNAYLGYMLGCDEYTDSNSDTHYLKSFSNLCREEAVGCEQLINTHNYSNPWEQTWNSSDASAITVPADNFVYLAQTNENSCMSSSVGCSALGQPVFNQDKTIVKNFEEVYRLTDPDLFDTTLCLEENVGCQTFNSGASSYYFKDPQDQTCEYIQPSGVEEYDWYKKAASYDVDSEKCPILDYQNFGVDFPAGACVGGTQDGQECLSGWDSYLDDKCIAGGGTCGSDSICSGGTEDANNCQSDCTIDGGYCSNWAGFCPATISSCTAFVDPLSDFNVDVVLNSGFSDTDNNLSPDSWTVSCAPVCYDDSTLTVSGDPPTEAYQSMDISTDTTYTITGQIKRNSSDSALIQVSCERFTASNTDCPSNDDEGFYLIDEIGELGFNCSDSAPSIARLVIDEAELDSSDFNRFSLRFFSGSCDRVKLSIGSIGSDGQIYDSVSLKETGIYTYLNSSLSDTKTECNGFVNNDAGCVLFNNRDNADWSNLDYNSYLTYNADKLSGLPDSCVDTDGSRFSCNTDELIKVSPDRDCAKWLECKSSDVSEGESICTDLGVCNKMNESGGCDNWPKEYSDDDTIKNMAFDSGSIDKIKNLSGYSKVGFDWGGSVSVDGNLPPAQMETKNSSVPPESFISVEVYNSDFEILDSGDPTIPDGWSGVNYFVVNNPVAAQQEGVEILSGRSILKIVGGNPNHAVTLLPPDAIEVGSEASYILSGWMNTKKAGTYSAVMIVYEYNANDALTATHSVSLDGGLDWTFKYIDFETTSATTQIQIRLDQSCTAPSCQGAVYFDDIIIKPLLKITDSGEYTPRMCRLYPQSESLSCEYQNDDGYIYQGLYGYCLEQDPLYPEYCLQWWPVDRISAQGTSRLGFDPTEFGDAEMYYCLKAEKRQTITQLTVSSSASRGIDCHGPNDTSVGWINTSLNIDHVDLTRSINVDCTCPAGGCPPFSWSYSFPMASGSCPGSVMMSCNGGGSNFSDRWCVGQTSGLGEQIGISLDVSESEDDPDGLYQGSPMPNNGRVNSISLMAADDRSEDGDGDCSEGCAWADFTSLNCTVTIPTWEWAVVQDECTDIAQISETASGKNKAWFERLKSTSSYDMPYLGFDYNTSAAPYGRLSSASLPPGATQFTLSNSSYTPYYCDEYVYNLDGSIVDPPRRCSWAGVASGEIYYYNPDPTSSAQAALQQLFARSYGLWEWAGASYTSDSTNFSAWNPPITTLCDPLDHSLDTSYCYVPPIINNIKLQDGAGDILLTSGSKVELKFNTDVDQEQFPMVKYEIDWKDGNNEILTGDMEDKPNENDPHIFSHNYNYTTLSNYDDPLITTDNIVCESDCSNDTLGLCQGLTGSTSSFCRVWPTIEITDNWGAKTEEPTPYIYVLNPFD